MITPISVQDKQTFIKWFLQHYKLKRRESKWILEYLVKHIAFLQNVHFVRDVKCCPKAIIISSSCSDGLPFLFYKKSIVTEDSEKLFHDMRLNQYEPLFIQLNFSNSIQNALYVAILEENPYLPEDAEEIQKDKDNAEFILQHSLFESRKNKLKQKIDDALDHFDQITFNNLVKELEALELNHQHLWKK